MALVQFATIDGRRVELSENDLTTERRCDGCGEFIRDQQAAQVSVTVISPSYGQIQSTRDAHTACLAAVAVDTASKAVHNLIPF